MITRFDFVLFLCLQGCTPSSCNPDPCKQCTRKQCELCEPCEQCELGESSLPIIQCPDTTCPTPNPSTSVCSCPATEVVDCSQCQTTTTTTSTTKTTTTTSKPTRTAPAITTATQTTSITITPQITKTTAAITTTPTTSSAHRDPAEQNSCLCSDNQGAVIGAAVGGAIFGSILTTIIFVYIYRRSKNPFNCKDGQTSNQTSRTVRNTAYGYNSDKNQVNSESTVPVNSAYSEINDQMRKSAVISPMRQADTSNTEEAYNHLGELDKEDRSDYYDHAGPAPSLSVIEDGYGVLSMKGEGNDNYNTVDTNFCGKSMTDENKQSNDYFILDKQND